MSNVRISQLNGFANILGEDYIPLVDSSSVTTYRCTVSSLVGYFAASGSVLSSSWSSASLSSLNASASVSSSYSATSSFLNYPNISTASVSLTTTSASYALSASYARSASAANSASFSSVSLSGSYAATSSVANTASYFNFTLTVPNFASHSFSSSFASSSISASYASSSTSASYARNSLTASYISTASTSPNVIKASISFVTSASFGQDAAHNNYTVLDSFNIESITFSRGTLATAPGIASWQLGGGYTYTNAIVKFINPLPNENYVVLGSGVEAGNNPQSYILQVFPNVKGYTSHAVGVNKSTTQFSMSFDSVSANRSNNQFSYFNLIVV